MRVSSFSRLSFIAISLFAIIFLATMYKVAQSLADSRAQNTNYQTLKSLATIKFNRTIGQYLRNGDANLLNQAEKELTEITAISQQLGVEELHQAIDEEAKLLHTNIETKFRAIGKLSGDPLALLRNVEAEILAINKELAHYANQSTALSDQQKVEYLTITNKIAKTSAEMINSRDKLFSIADVSSDGIDIALDELNTFLTTLNSFPLLEIYPSEDESDDDDFFDDEDDKEDLSENALSDLNSLVNRYQKELSTTLALKQQRESGFSLLAKQVGTLEEIILTGEQKINDTQKRLNTQLNWIVAGLLLFLVIFLISNYWLQRSVILNPLRKLRDSFVQLVEQGKVDNIRGIAEKTELGEISQSFNRMVNKLAEDDQQKAQQLDLVAKALSAMEHQVANIYQSSTSTSEHVQAARSIMIALGEATENVNTLSSQVVDNAKATQQAMESSQSRVAMVLDASKTTNQAAKQSKSAITSLSQAVDSVTSIVDVISAIADQTNLLALNAAIEAARAGEHGRGFSVVADEVRQLAGKTQESLNQISNRLDELQGASHSIENIIIDIEKASENQQQIADELQATAKEVTGQAQRSAHVAMDTLNQITQQKEHFNSFEVAMSNVDKEVTESQQLADSISNEVSTHVRDITSTLKKAS